MENRLVKTKRPGRPRQPETKSVIVGIRLSMAERTIVGSKAQLAGVRLTTYIRQVILEGRVKQRLTEEERTFVRQLVGMSNNINQIAKACHENGLMRALAYFEKLRAKIDGVLDKLKK